MRNNATPLVMIFFNAALQIPSYLEKENAMAQPIQNTKKGYTRSVGVQPSHPACLNGGKIMPHEPGLFTIHMKATVTPRSTSSEIYRFISNIFDWFTCSYSILQQLSPKRRSQS